MPAAEVQTQGGEVQGLCLEIGGMGTPSPPPPPPHGDTPPPLHPPPKRASMCRAEFPLPRAPDYIYTRLFLSSSVYGQGGLAHLPIGNAWPLCTARAFPILSLTTKVPTGFRDNCPFTFPPLTLPLPPSSPPPLPPALCPLPTN